MSRFVRTLATATVAVVLLSGAAQADSRLFGASSDVNGVAVTGASLDGKALTSAGQGGGVTFFRIDSPGASVPCTNHITFTGSNGKVVAMDANVCANGAQVTVPFSTAAAAPPPPAAQPPAQPAPPPAAAPGAPAAQPAGVQPVTISVDDPQVTIDSVFMGGNPVAINRRTAGGVEVLIAPGPNGITCSRDLGLVLSDGRRIARAVDICANDWKVDVKLAAGGGTSAPAAQAAPQPPAPPAPAAQTAPSAQQPAPAPGGPEWMFTPTRDNGSLAFAVPNTDESEFTAVCAPGSRQATIALGRSAADVRPGAPVTVVFSAGTFSQSYRATGSDVSQASGLSNPLIKLSTNDPLWPAIIRESALTVRIGSAAPYTLSLKGSATKANQFLAYCSPAPPPTANPQPVPPPGATVQPAPMPAPSAASGDIPFACNDGSFIRVFFDDANGRVIVSDGRGPPLMLHRTASLRGARYVGGGNRLVGHADTITWAPAGGYPATCRPQ